MLITNLIFTAIETGIIVNNVQKDAWLVYVELIYSCVYVVEMLLKWMAFGWTRYWRKLSNKFDGSLAIINFIFTVAFFHPSGAKDFVVSRLLLLTRMLRLLGLLTHIPKFAVIFTIYGSLVGVFSRVIGVLIGFYYFFSFLGI